MTTNPAQYRPAVRPAGGTCTGTSSHIATVVGGRPAAESAYPQITAVRRAASALIEHAELPGVPVAAGTVVPVRGLLTYLTDPQRTGTELDAVWRVLLERARRDADWQLVAFAMAVPRLAQITARAAGRTHVRLVEEVTAAILGAFAEAVLTLTPQPGRGLLVHQLLRRAQAAAQRVVDQARAAHRRAPEWHGNSDTPAVPSSCGHTANHPDLALARLVAHEVITPDEAELIARHRIEHTTLRQLGAQRGWYPMRTTRALRAAERKVADALGHQGDQPH